jgi:hypothetical protein
MHTTKTYLLFICLLFSHLLTAQKINKHPFTIGETVEIKSGILNETRTLNIYLPNGYAPDSARTYPVIYLLDGSADEDFIHIAGLVQFGSFPWINMIPESIVVGIANVDRKRDFTFPTTVQKDKTDFPTTGKSETFIRFIEQELQPFIAKNYRTAPVRTLIGQSLGGLLATEILFKKPDMFDNYIIVSPSLWWDNESLLKTTPVPFQLAKSIYIATGKEGDQMERPAKELFSKMESLSNKSTAVYFNFFEKLDHGDALHLAAYDAFEKIFSAKTK